MTATDIMPIAIRAYTESAKAKPPGQPRGNDAPSELSLVFDCETKIDAAQSLRFGLYQVRRDKHPIEAGIFFDPLGLTPAEMETLTAYASAHGLQCRSVRDFVNKVFYRIGHDRRGTIVGFNLPFDISRIAISHGEARRSMRGGFTFKLSNYPANPPVRVKHLSRRTALIDFASPPEQATPRGSLNRDIRTPAHRGFFVDVSTLASALTSEGFTLARLCERLKVPTQKHAGAEHGAALTDAYLDYASADVQATWECYLALRDQFKSHALTTPLHRVLSEASIGKAYLKDMGIAPLLQRMPDLPRAIFGKIMSAYFGGRAEVRWRREIKRVLYCDFKSMYPTVNALMGLWRFVIADGFSWHDATDEARRLLDECTLDHLRDPKTWSDLTILVRVQPHHDLFPVRAKYDGRMNTIGLNFLTSKGRLWMTLADCIAAKLLSGKAPKVIEAIRFEPGIAQSNLKPIDLFGNAAYRVDPSKEDVFVRLVDLRDEAKRKSDPLQQAIKIIANATSYGIFIEVLRDDASKPESIAIYGPSGGRRFQQTTAIEQPGRYFNPLLGVLITGAARLMLALAERNVIDAGMDWAFCDTDSIAIVKPDEMGEADFATKTDGVIGWFDALNPYRASGSILKNEDANFTLNRDGRPTTALAPLYCFAISAKRYALFNIDETGRPVIRKASAHGLGHYLAPYKEEDASNEIPAPPVPLSEIGVDRWQYDLWYKIIGAALAGHSERVPLDYHPALQLPAVMRFGISSPHLERWMKIWNERRPYADRARPFGFMVTFQARRVFALDEFASASDLSRPGRRKQRADIKPIAPFDRDSAKAAAKAFDRETGGLVSADQLKTFAEALAQFHLHPEDKFLNGDYWDRGRTERRHVVASGVRLTGKEANKWEEMTAALEDADIADFGSVPPSREPAT